MVLELKIEVQMLINNKLKSERALGRIAPVPANYFLTFRINTLGLVPKLSPG